MITSIFMTKPIYGLSPVMRLYNWMFDDNGGVTHNGRIQSIRYAHQLGVL